MYKFKILILLCLLMIPARALQAGESKYALLRLEGAVNPIIAEHIVQSLERARKDGMQFAVLQMDTPGGLLTSMREIIKAILTSEIPVVVYTYPKGAQAASAGGFIMLAAHIAVMAPGTEIGAMHPVSILPSFGSSRRQGEERSGQDTIMEKKLLNDTVAYARSLAQKRKRNEAWAVKAVREAASSTYTEALRQGVIDLIAEDMPDLLRKLNGKRVEMPGKTVLLNTMALTAVPYEMDWKQRTLNFFADPQIVFFLFIIAVVGIGMEFKNPGMVVPGVIGTASFLVFLMAIRILPINLAGLALIILAVVLVVLELKITSYGLLTVGGIVSFVIGSMILFDSPLPGFSVPLASILGAVVFVLAFVFVVVRAVLNAHRARVSTGAEGIIGETGRALRDFEKTGKIQIHGEIWEARCDEPVRKDDRLTVISVEGMMLNVRKAPE